MKILITISAVIVAVFALLVFITLIALFLDTRACMYRDLPFPQTLIPAILEIAILCALSTRIMMEFK